MSLKAVFFDIDDTLFSTTDFASKARRAAVEAMRRRGLRLPTEHILRELQEVIAEFSSNHEHHFDKLLLRLPRRSWDGVNPAILVAAGVQAYHDAKFHQLRPYPDVPPVLARLARTDLVRGVITAGLEVKQADKLLRLGLYDYFTPTAIFISDQIGISKPNSKLFQRACDEVGVAPRETMYVGDHPTHDVDPANALGMITVHVRRGKHAPEQGRTKPTYTLKNFKELLTVLRKDFNVRV
ncbi:MAG TPA: TIGR02253 family HAD-type hydrolase [Planctomycetota bacterium]|jgi:putative hydrolase of the HAD superfamily|nr:TIGR02253 family HAD-type hydrolase [Planctomycetota bacterium]